MSLQATTYIVQTEEQRQADLLQAARQAAKEVRALYTKDLVEPLVPKEYIMKEHGWGEKKFTSERRRRKVAPVEKWGNAPVYRASQFRS